MEDFNSKYTGEEVETLLDKVQEVNIAAVDAGEEVDGAIYNYATTDYVDAAIANSIVGTINKDY